MWLGVGDMIPPAALAMMSSAMRGSFLLLFVCLFVCFFLWLMFLYFVILMTNSLHIAVSFVLTFFVIQMYISNSNQLIIIFIFFLTYLIYYSHYLKYSNCEAAGTYGLYDGSIAPSMPIIIPSSVLAMPGVMGGAAAGGLEVHKRSLFRDNVFAFIYLYYLVAWCSFKFFSVNPITQRLLNPKEKELWYLRLSFKSYIL